MARSNRESLLESFGIRRSSNAVDKTAQAVKNVTETFVNATQIAFKAVTDKLAGEEKQSEHQPTGEFHPLPDETKPESESSSDNGVEMTGFVTPEASCQAKTRQHTGFKSYSSKEDMHEIQQKFGYGLLLDHIQEQGSDDCFTPEEAQVLGITPR